MDSIQQYLSCLWNYSWIQYYIDIDFARWLLWLFTPILVAFLFPLVILLLLYFSFLMIFIVKHRHRLAFDELINNIENRQYKDGALHAISIIWEAHGWLWYGYEVEGLENIPDEGPAVILYYHGALPIDYYHFLAKLYIQKKIVVNSIVDRFLVNFPGFKVASKVLQLFPGTVGGCVNILNDGCVIAISPGGVREAQFSTNYDLVWTGRIGFAKVIKQSKAPVILMFTRNVRESYRTLQIFPRFFRRIYDTFKLPLMPVYGGFPVKMKTFVSKPIQFDPDATVEEIAKECHTKLTEMIKEHQKLPGSILRALFERFTR